MGKLIKFNKEEAQKGLSFIKQQKISGMEDLNNIAYAVSMVQQSYASARLLQDGYCGAGLKKEVANANTLGHNIAVAGQVVQGVILKEIQKGEG